MTVVSRDLEPLVLTWRLLSLHVNEMYRDALCTALAAIKIKQTQQCYLES
jgi:hypothetical protein